MGGPWLRLQADVFDDARVSGLSLVAQNVWFRVLCAAKNQGRGGSLPRGYDLPEFLARNFEHPELTTDSIGAALDEILASGLLARRDGCLTVRNWSKYQKDPTASARQTKRRSGSDSVTHRHRDSVESRTDTVTDESRTDTVTRSSHGLVTHPVTGLSRSDGDGDDDEDIDMERKGDRGRGNHRPPNERPTDAPARGPTRTGPSPDPGETGAVTRAARTPADRPVPIPDDAQRPPDPGRADADDEDEPPPAPAPDPDGPPDADTDAPPTPSRAAVASPSLFPLGDSEPASKPRKRRAKKPKPDSAATTAAVRAVFGHWQATLGNPHSKLSAERRAKIKTRLGEGYTVAELCEAIDGCARSKFHRGGNEDGTVYNSIGLIMRNAEHVDDFIARARGPVGGRPLARGEDNVS
mgnify:CR=1 FL=1